MRKASTSGGTLLKNIVSELELAVHEICSLVGGGKTMSVVNGMLNASLSRDMSLSVTRTATFNV